MLLNNLPALISMLIYLRCKGSFFGYFGLYTIQFITNKVLYQLDILKILTAKKKEIFSRA
jgi:hypothetical protein